MIGSSHPARGRIPLGRLNATITQPRSGPSVIAKLPLPVDHRHPATSEANVHLPSLHVEAEKFEVAETAARLIRLVPKMAGETELAESGRFDLPMNASSKLRPHRD
jgi:hypothetical protein